MLRAAGVLHGSLAMRRAALAALLCGLALLLADAATAAPPAPPPSGPILEAWKNITSFHEDLARIDRARDLLETEVARAPSLEALLLLSWVHLIWADYRAPNIDAKLASYERGREVARRAIDMAPRSPEAHLWYAANLGRWAITKGKLRAAFLLSTLKQEIQAVLELDPNHVPGLALAGSFYLETPAVFGGDVPRAEGYLRKALSQDPHFTRAGVELARCLIAEGRYDEAREQLKRVIDERQPSYIADWVMRHRPTAERLLAEIRTK
jgi:tetratricopeptide (TPR) repeat protein